jgi:hypothetical protein
MRRFGRMRTFVSNYSGMIAAALQESQISIKRFLRFITRSSLKDSAKQARKKTPPSVAHQARSLCVKLRRDCRKLATKSVLCVSFDELIGVIDQKLGCGHGLGDLAKYDIAHRIGAHLGLLSEQGLSAPGNPSGRQPART